METPVAPAQTTAAPAAAVPAVPAPQPQPYTMASLYVGDLHHDVTEANLFEKFSVVGPVTSIRVCRDIISRRSLGYAYVNFQNSNDAEKALDSMNFDVLQDRAIRIMWSQRDPTIRKSGQGNVFIKNLGKTVDNKTLFDAFSRFGDILSLKIVADDSGPKGYGFIHFEKEESATEAIKELNNKLIDGKKIYVGKFMSREEREKIQGDKQKQFTNVFVKNLPENIDDEKLSAMFEPHGKILSAKIMLKEDGTSKGFGFVNFEKHDEAEAAVNELNEKEIDGKNITCCRAQKKIERQKELKKKFEAVRREKMQRYQGINLYVKNLDDSIDDDRLRKEFEQYGQITSAKVMTTESNKSRGFGFVCFNAPDEATKAATDMYGKILEGKPLYVALAQRKEERRANLQNRYTQQPATQYQVRPSMGPNWNAPGQYSNQAMQQSFMSNQFAPAIRMSGPGVPFNPQMRQQNQWRGPTGMPARAMQGMQTGMSGQRFNAFRGPPAAPQYMNGAQGSRGPMPNNGRAIQGSPNVFPGQPNMMAPQGPMRGQSGPMGAMGKQQNPMMMMSRQMPGHMPQQNYPANMTAPQAPKPGAPTSESQLTTEQLVNASTADQKTMIGERLYPKIHQLYPEYAGKITGMLLEIDNAELVLMLDAPTLLDAKATEAMDVLKRYLENKPAAATVEGGDAAAGTKIKGATDGPTGETTA